MFRQVLIVHLSSPSVQLHHFMSTPLDWVKNLLVCYISASSGEVRI